MYLFFDTETNGMAKNFKAPVTDLDNWPRVTQLGWQLYNEKEQLISEGSYLIKPDGWTIPKEKFFIDNNMSTERCEEFGIPLSEAVGKFMDDIKQADYLIAHNMQFDSNVMGAEFIRLGVTPPKNPEKICTMQESTDYCRLLPFRYGTYKWPTLTELHVKLFEKEFEGAHDALDDVKACAKSFFELKKRGKILKS
jgi:DNA polymerase III subunit epsilon